MYAREKVREMLAAARRADPERWQILDGRSDAFYYFSENLPYDSGKITAYMYFSSAGFSAEIRHGIPRGGKTL